MLDTIFIGLCLTHEDWVKFKFSIVDSFTNLSISFKKGCFFYIVIQGDVDANDINHEELIKLNFKFEIKLEKVKGVSNARNICIEKAKKINAKYILFHDASIYWPKNAADFIYKYRKIRPKVNVSFSNIHNEHNEHNEHINNLIKTKINPIYAPYVWSYLFKLDDIDKLRFDINHGPGENTFFKSGEDIIFLYCFFSHLNNFKVTTPKNKSICIYHPSRDSSYSKHYTYAKGQGRVFRIILTKHFSPQILLDTFLFFGNAIFRCVFFKKNSLKILKERIYGFIKD